MSEQIREEIERIVERREKAEQELLRPDGSKRFSDQEHSERTMEIHRAKNEEFAPIEKEIRGHIGTAKDELLTLEHHDLTSELSVEELQEANARRAFVADEVHTLALPELVERLRAVALSNDKPRMFLYHHVATQRLNFEGRAEGASGVREALSTLQGKLAPEYGQKLEAAKKRLADLKYLERDASYRKQGVADAAESLIRRKFTRGIYAGRN